MTAPRLLLALAAVLALPSVAAHLGGFGPEVHVVLRDGAFGFEPEEISVARGQTLAWDDGTGSPHTVTSTESLGSRVPDGRFDHELEPDGTVEQVFFEEGVVAYVCRIHEEMWGLVRVVAALPAVAPWAALLAAALLLGRTPLTPRRRAPAPSSRPS